MDAAANSLSQTGHESQACSSFPALAVWSKNQRGRLCRLDPSDENIAKCAVTFSEQFNREDLITLCSHGGNLNALRDCLSAPRATWAASERAMLCAGAESNSVGLCVRLVEDPRFSHGQIIELCAKTVEGTASIKAQCVESSMRTAGVDTYDVVRLCQKGQSNAASCAEAVRKGNRGLSNDQVIQICHKAASSSPQECALACGRASSEVCTSVCQEAQTASPGQCAASANKANIQPEIAASLCVGAESDVPVSCFQHGGWQQVQGASFNPELRASLCNRAHPIGILPDRLKCVRQAPSQLSLEERVSLCNGTTVDLSKSQTGPSTCLRDILRGNVPVSLEEAHGFCRAHNSFSRSDEHGLARAQCLRPMRQSSPPRAAALQLCKDHHLVPSGVGASQLQCAADAVKVDPTMSTQEIIDLCRFATDGGPSYCYTQSHKIGLASAHRAATIAMCAVEPLHGMCCIEALQRGLSKSKLQQFAASAALVCKSPLREGNCRGPAECFAESISRKLNEEFAANLCQSAKDSYPAQCAFQLRKHYKELSDDEVQEMCSNTTHGDLGIEQREPTSCMEAGKGLLKARVFDEPLPRLRELCTKAQYGIDAIECIQHYRKRVGTSRVESQILVDLCTSVPNGTQSIEACVLATSLASPFREKLCIGSESSAPAVCASRLEESSLKLDAQLIVDACQNAKFPGEAIANCVVSGVEAKVKRVTKRSVIKLCQFRHDGQSVLSGSKGAQHAANLAEVLDLKPVDILDLVRSVVSLECARLGSRRGLSLSQIKELCSNAGDDPATVCLESLATAFSPGQAVRLCAKAGKDHSQNLARCIQAATSGGLDDVESIVQLCQSPLDVNLSNDMRKCLRLGSEVGLGQNDLARLCTNATSELPVRCFVNLQREMSSLTGKQIIELCLADANEAPGCVRDVFDKSRDFELRELLSFCSVPFANITALCVASAPSGWTRLDKIELCTNAESHIPGECAASISRDLRISRGQMIKLCQKAKDLRPVKCAQALVPTAGADIAVVICRQPERLALEPGVSEAPQRCASHSIVSRSLTPNKGLSRRMIEACRVAASRPTRLTLLQTRELYELVISGKLLTGDNLGPLIYELVDQFNFPTNLSDAPGRGLGWGGQDFVIVRLRRDGITNEFLPVENLETDPALYSNGHWVQFPQVRVVGVSGDFELIASFASLPLIRSLPFKFSAHRNMAEALRALLRCASLPVRLQCKNPLDEADEVHYVSYPWSSWLYARSCEEELESVGIEVLESPHPFSQGTYVRLKNGPAKLLAGFGVPTEEMTAEEILGIEANVTSSQLRKAYHRASLEWHPDRWVSFHPDLQAQAADVFLKISRARSAVQERLTAALESEFSCSSSAV